MSPSIALSLVLLSPPSRLAPLRGSPPGVVDATGEAWAVVHAGQLWVCWSIAPDCWRRVELEADSARATQELDEDDPLDPSAIEPALEPEARSILISEQWRLGFSDAATLWIELDDRRWRLDRGARQARLVEQVTAATLARPRAFHCGPRAKQPALVGGRLDWADTHRCDPPAPSGTCVSTQVSPRPRRPSPVQLRAGIELGSTRGWTSVDEDRSTPSVGRIQARAGIELLFVIELSFDRARTLADDRARAALLRHQRIRALPSIPAGPLAEAERRAQAALLCGGQP